MGVMTTGTTDATSETAPAMPRRALVIAPQPFFTPRGTPLSVYYRTLVTAEQGVRVDLLTYGRGEDVTIDGVRIIRIPAFRRLGEVKIGPSPLKLFLDVFLVLWTCALLLRHRYDFVHAHEEAVFFCLPLKSIFRFKLVYDMHSSLPQQLTNFGFTRSRLLIGTFAWLERASLRAADAVITICPDLADYALRLLDDPDKHELIENSIFEDVRLARPMADAQDGTQVAIPADRPLIVYAGTLEPYQGIELLLRAFAAARARAPDSFLLIVGGTPEQVAAYRALARELDIAAHCYFTGRLPQRAARRLVARAAVQVSPRIHGTNTPLKVYEQLASGIPLVATDIYSHRQVLDDKVAFLAQPEPAAFADALVAALHDAPARAERIAAAQRLYACKYSRAAYVAKLRRLLRRLA
ncbi:MAG: glycosyltransferase [Alphaproteobacteria bacterium]|nr:MAG: glycosyltransferase [Alphaproteobacteria bacterium]